jgi:hypothetical protein
MRDFHLPRNRAWAGLDPEKGRRRMTEERTAVMTGGCQCGKVRYALYAEPAKADICHCRMCQRALGNLFMAVASLKRGDFAWTRGTPATFRSSSAAERGFCADCGTPLSFRYLARDSMSVTIGSLDAPARARPSRQYGIESRVPWFHELADLPATRTEQDPPPGGMAALESYQDRAGR